MGKSVVFSRVHTSAQGCIDIYVNWGFWLRGGGGGGNPQRSLTRFARSFALSQNAPVYIYTEKRTTEKKTKKQKKQKRTTEKKSGVRS